MADRRDYEIGYGKPPKASRFQPGQSGNPKGRPKGARGVRTIIREVLTSPVTVKTAGRSKSLPAIEAIGLRLRQKALEGDYRSMMACFGLGAEHLPEETQDAAASLSELDQQIFDTFFRLREPPAEPSAEDPNGQRSGEKEDD